MDFQDFNISTPGILTNIRVPSDQVIESLGFLFTNSGKVSHTRIICNVW